MNDSSCMTLTTETIMYKYLMSFNADEASAVIGSIAFTAVMVYIAVEMMR